MKVFGSVGKEYISEAQCECLRPPEACLEAAVSVIQSTWEHTSSLYDAELRRDLDKLGHMRDWEIGVSNASSARALTDLYQEKLEDLVSTTNE